MDKSQIQQNIDNMRAELAAMEEKLSTIEKFEFVYEDRKSFLLTVFRIYKDDSGDDKDFLEQHRYRKTEANAEAELLRNKQGNFMGALFEQIDVNYTEGIDWKNEDQKKYYIYLNTIHGEWNLSNASFVMYPSVTYTSKKEVAKKAAELLNSGQVVYPTE